MRAVCGRECLDPIVVLPNVGACLGVTVGRYSFGVRLLHPLASAGLSRRTKLLAGELVRLVEHDTISREMIRYGLEENDLKPWQRKMWCVPKVDAECPCPPHPLENRHR